MLGAGLLLLCVYYISTRGVFQGKYSGDGLFGFEYLRALVYEHTIDMKKVVPEWLPYFSTDTLTHHMPNRCPFGPVILWMPFYLIGCAIATVGHWLHLAGHLKPDSAFHAWMAGLGSLAAALAGYRQVYALVRRNVSVGAARLGATVAVWATPIAWYAVTQPMYQHACAFGCVALLIERWDATRDHVAGPLRAAQGGLQWRRFVWLGLIGGLAMAMRLQEALFLLLPGGEIAYHVVRGPERRRWFAGGLVLIGATLVAFSPQLAAWHFYTGAFHPPQVEPIRWSSPMFVVALFSTRAGLFPWSPIVYATVLGVVLTRRARLLTYSLTVLFLVNLYIVAAAWVPSGAYSYGARRLSDCAPLFGLGAALLYDRVRWKRVVAGFAAFCVLATVVTMELQRAGRTKSSGGYARTAGTYLGECGAPKWMQTLVDRIGYPFVQPAGWLFALYHRVSPSAFEGIVGNFMLDRDGQWFTVLSRKQEFDVGHRPYIAAGLELAPKELARVTGPVRVLVSMFASERIGVLVSGTIGPGDVHIAWNGVDTGAQRLPAGLSFQLPAARVRAGVNEVTMDLPLGSRLDSLEFSAYDTWWR